MIKVNTNTYFSKIGKPSNFTKVLNFVNYNNFFPVGHKAHHLTAGLSFPCEAKCQAMMQEKLTLKLTWILMMMMMT